MVNNGHRIITVNISWNPHKWRNLYINPKAGHVYVRTQVGHESLNFNFNKSIDTDEDIYGYVRWTNPPRKLSEEAAVMIFYTKNTETSSHEGQIVGIYGDVKILDPVKKAHYKGFLNDELWANITAKRNLSLLFPIPLDSKKYSLGERLVPEVGFTYQKGVDFAEQVVLDEINACTLRQGSILLDEYEKLKAIYFFITGKEYVEHSEKQDEQEQEELIAIERTKTREELINKLKNVTPLSSIQTEVHGKQYKRDNETIAELKLLRGLECQICKTYILKKDNTQYVEAAHIRPKSQRGPETPENILILCPNHHKEFDLGNTIIFYHDKEKITFELNGINYTIKLSLE